MLNLFRRKPENHGRELAEPSPRDGWRFVINPMGRGWAKGFDPTREYEFHCTEWDAPRRFRMSDMQQDFNVYGLYWRELPNAGRELALIGAEKRRLSHRELYKRTHDELRASMGLPAIQWRG
jgi:hypothetical protein